MIAQLATHLERLLPFVSLLVAIAGLGGSVFSAIKTRNRFYNDYLKRKRPHD